MSVPARRVGEPERPRHVALPARPPAARPRTPTPSHPHRRARRGFHPAFFLFSAVIVALIVVGAVSLSAMLVQTSFRVDSLEQRIRDLGDRGETLVTQAAQRSSPSRIARWARHRGMVMPDEVVVLTVPGSDAP